MITALFGHLLPIPIQPTLAWSELGIALLYGALTALVFAIAPLGAPMTCRSRASSATRSIRSGAGRASAT